jgi:hypothetical protein
MDLNEVADGDIIQISQVQEALFTLGARLRKPLICAVQGAARGQGPAPQPREKATLRLIWLLARRPVPSPLPTPTYILCR